MNNGYWVLLSFLFLGAPILHAETQITTSASSLTCSSNCTCQGSDGSASIPMTTSGSSEAEAKQNAQNQCDSFARMSGAAPGACTVTNFSCR